MISQTARIAELEAQVAFLNTGLAFAWRQGAAAQFKWFHTPNSGAISISVPETENPYGPHDKQITP